ncbi:ATP-binding cassette domain-containing protein [Saccharibacillus alkalitolerans]|uniref:ABC transporter ATP-binding protein n=1 Tax=Saccharibacillus alkalitolerans TaxID=2705290 RepID=A0ABX0F1Q4_9BACL|nr:ABC transporter ATP-binding protein [Saccharibacillus alkalitolerans]NGZ73800.1 ABC transporter ATP-binding protein [Saccharibacillus alkalitolerans]
MVMQKKIRRRQGADPVIALQAAGRSYGARRVLDGISLELRQGESVILRGGNGSGKSTLLKMTAGIIPASSGRVVPGSRDLRVGFAPDRLPKLRMTSNEYLTHMGRIAGMPRTALEERIEELHVLLDLPAGSSSMLIHYSKGMLQKVNLMQACLGEPDLLLLDEPFSGLDTDSSEKLLTLLHGLRARGTAIVTALHDPLPSWEAVSATYRLRGGVLVREDAAGAEDEETDPIFYELDGLLSEEARPALGEQFPDVQWQAAGNALRCLIPSGGCEVFMQNFWAAGGTVLSLRRKEKRG